MADAVVYMPMERGRGHEKRIERGGREGERAGGGGRGGPAARERGRECAQSGTQGHGPHQTVAHQPLHTCRYKSTNIASHCALKQPMLR
jgi:hypothetical protein